MSNHTILIIHSLRFFSVIFFLTVSAWAAKPMTEIRAGSEPDFRPYAFTDENGQPTGFGVELLKAVADKMGLELSITPGPWDQVWGDLVGGKLDVLPVVARTPGREPLVNFSLPHTETYDAFFRRKIQPPLKNLAAAAGLRIAVLRSDAAHHQLLEHNFNGTIIPVDLIPDGLRLVGAGKCDAFLCSKVVGVLERKQSGIRDVIAGPPIPDYKRTFSFAVRKGNAELVERLNQGLLIVKSDGTYDAIYKRWLTIEDPGKRWLLYFQWTMAGLLSLALLAGIQQWLVRRRTRQLARAEKELLSLNATLEQRVADRTAALRQSEERMRSERENLEKLNKEMDLFMKILSHDLRAPLRSIQGFSEIIQKEHGDSLNGEVKEFIGDIHTASQQMSLLIEDVLGIFKSSTSKRPYEKVDIAKVLAEIISILKGSHLNRRTEIITLDIPPQIEGDPMKLRQIFQNLLNNSIKFSQSSIHPIKIRIGYVDHGDSHEFHVKDNGIGIDNEHLNKIFQPFYKLHPNHEYEGSGAGLYIVKKLVEDHKGKLWVNSKSGKGTTFYFSIPKNLIAGRV